MMIHLSGNLGFDLLSLRHQVAKSTLIQCVEVGKRYWIICANTIVDLTIEEAAFALKTAWWQNILLVAFVVMEWPQFVLYR
jgi:hypothetical protein